MSETLLSDRFDMPKRVIRPLRDGEALPFYSTEQLLFGVCHLVLPATALIETKESAKKLQIKLASAKGAAVKRLRAAEKFAHFYSTVKSMLEQGDSNRDIALALGMQDRYVSRHLKSYPELRALSKARKTKYKHIVARSRGAADRLKAVESSIRADLKTASLYMVAPRYGFDHRTLKRLLGAQSVVPDRVDVHECTTDSVIFR